MHLTTKLPILILALMAIILSGCSASKLDQTIKASKSPVALVFQDGKLQVIDVASGQRLPTCEEIGPKDPQRKHACKSLDSVEILSRNNIEMVQYKSSVCVSFIFGGSRTDLCAPPYPLFVIELMMD